MKKAVADGDDSAVEALKQQQGMVNQQGAFQQMQ